MWLESSVFVPQSSLLYSRTRFLPNFVFLDHQERPARMANRDEQRRMVNIIGLKFIDSLLSLSARLSTCLLLSPFHQHTHTTT